MNLALKYRPSSFDDIIGQDVLVRILKNSFSSGPLNSPLLMVGASGVGKTTCARIVSLCLNCVNGPTPDPCGACNICMSIKDHSNPDVIEIDAASNTGVDDIRVIIENSRYLPTYCRFKVYIIDEVHMLSVSAFNALLKTLEEQDSHVRFILATTEVRKVPITVLSRCHKLSLGKVPVDRLLDHIVKIAEKEGIEHDNTSLKLIAEGSSGSVRSALFLLEQSYIYAKGKISEESVRTLLGYVDQKSVSGTVYHILRRDAVAALELFRKVCEYYSPIYILEGMQTVIYELCVRSVDSAFHTDVEEDLLALSETSSTSLLSRMWQVLSNGIQEAKNSELIQKTCEMVIIRMCYLADLPSPRKIANFLLSSSDVCKSSGKDAALPTSNFQVPLKAPQVEEEKSEAPSNMSSSLMKRDLAATRGGVGEKSNERHDNKVYNPEGDKAVMEITREFEGASVVGLRDVGFDE